ncbi:MAG: hypothetical protein MZU95_03260 [Desulfomicrobium escambiense]|nr:hypothetical protein [Desulfomicrobium escambiense]
MPSPVWLPRRPGPHAIRFSAVAPARPGAPSASPRSRPPPAATAPRARRAP